MSTQSSKTRTALRRLLVTFSVLIVSVGLSVVATPAAQAATPQVAVGMPFDGNWANSFNTDPTIHTAYYGDWAVDLFAGAGTEVKLNVTSPDGPVTFSKNRENDTCSTYGTNIAGRGIVLNVLVNNAVVGSIDFEHLDGISAGPYSNGMVLGKITSESLNSACYSARHSHVELKNSASGTHACYVKYGLGSTVNAGSVIGVLGSTTVGTHDECPSVPTGQTEIGPEPETADTPVGDLSVVRVPGGVQLSGWSFDPNSTDPITVHIYGGTGYAQNPNPLVATTANLYRPDVQEAHPGYGNYHGFATTMSVGVGEQTYCAYGINVGPGQNRRFDCVKFTVSSDPVGNLETIRRVPGGVSVSGWALDPDTAGAISAHVYGGDGVAASGRPLGAGSASGDRPDVGAAWPGYGNAHGYSNVLVPAGPGAQKFCAYGINSGPGANSQLVCRDFTVNSDPIGNLETVTRVAGGVQVSGWALDPDIAGPIAVHVYGGDGVAAPGRPLGAGSAGGDRPDVGTAWPGYGNAHGYSFFVAAPDNPQTFCAYGINSGAGANAKLVCRTA